MDKHRAEWLYTDAPRLGISRDDARALARIAQTLHTWGEHECNGTIQRDEETGRCSWHSSYDGRRLGPTPDRETGAIRRAEAIVARYPGLRLEVQGDPRGAPIRVHVTDERGVPRTYTPSYRP